MDQIKIGKFIAELRKTKNMTQQQLGEKIGVSSKTISKWETGKGMPDLSSLKPLSDYLEISINELLSGEKIEEEKYTDKLEENIINTIEYSDKQVNNKKNLIGILLIIFGFFISFSAMSIFASESSWGSIYSVLGTIISLVGVSKLTRKLSYGKRLLFNYGYFILFVAMLLVIDYIGVITIHQAPRFSYNTKTGDNMIIYNTPFYNVYRMNRDTKNEYYIVDIEKKYTSETVPNVPFDRDESGIDNIIKYKSKYVGDNSNDSNLINNLPLSEYGYTFEIDSENLGLTINYHITDWYIKDNLYLQKSLIYNSVSIISLIDNVEYIEYNFTGNSYKVSRDIIESEYPSFYKIVHNNEMNKENFNQFLENKMKDNEFIERVFAILFNNN